MALIISRLHYCVKVFTTLWSWRFYFQSLAVFQKQVLILNLPQTLKKFLLMNTHFKVCDLYRKYPFVSKSSQDNFGNLIKIILTQD